jgi:hypothetical protein
VDSFNMSPTQAYNFSLAPILRPFNESMFAMRFFIYGYLHKLFGWRLKLISGQQVYYFHKAPISFYWTCSLFCQATYAHFQRKKTPGPKFQSRTQVVSKETDPKQAQWCAPMVPGLGWLRQKDCLRSGVGGQSEQLSKTLFQKWEKEGEPCFCYKCS